MLVDYIRATHGNQPADWARDFWTGERGRYSIAHAKYAGCNNNMGVETLWRLIKKILPKSASLRRFLAALCHVIKSYRRPPEETQVLEGYGWTEALINHEGNGVR